MQFDAVLFDLDGTLLDTAPDFVRVVNQLRERHDYPPLPAEDIRKVVSNGARALVSLAFDHESDSEPFLARHRELLDLYEDQVAIDTVFFPGLDQALRTLEQRNIPWGIVTNKPARFTDPLLSALRLDDRCGVAVCPDHVTHRKPHPESLLLACDKLAVKPENCVYVGDHVRDIEAGKSANMFTIAAGYGYIEDDDPIAEWHADRIFMSPDALAEWLLA